MKIPDKWALFEIVPTYGQNPGGNCPGPFRPGFINKFYFLD